MNRETFVECINYGIRSILWRMKHEMRNYEFDKDTFLVELEKFIKANKTATEIDIEDLSPVFARSYFKRDSL